MQTNNDTTKETNDNNLASRGWMMRLVRRCRAACRTNEPQSTAAIMLSLMMVAVAGRAGAEWWQCVTAGAFWPIIAFLSNLANPIPPNTDYQTKL
jgi:hypothetical protein